MLHIFVDPAQMQGDLLYVRGGDVNHMRNVLRLKPGDEISVRTGQDEREYRYGIEEYTDCEVICRLRFVKESDVELPVKVYLFQGLPKSDKMDLIVQKADHFAVRIFLYAVAVFALVLPRPDTDLIAGLKAQHVPHMVDVSAPDI